MSAGVLKCVSLASCPISFLPGDGFSVLSLWRDLKFTGCVLESEDMSGMWRIRFVWPSVSVDGLAACSVLFRALKLCFVAVLLI